MADTINHSIDAVLGFERTDGSVQNITIPNTPESLEAETARDVMTYLTSNNVLVDSKDGSVLTTDSVLTSAIVDTYKINFDLTGE